MTIREAQPDDFGVDLHALARALFRSFRYVLPLALIVAIGTYAMLSGVKPRYSAETQLLIEPIESDLTRTTTAPDASGSQAQALLDEQGVTSQVQLVRSRELARAVAEKLDLGKLPEFDPVLRGRGLLATILVPLGLMVDPAKSPAEERVLQSFEKKLSVYALAKSRVIVVEFTAQDPDLAARVANAIAEQYLFLQQAVRRDLNKDAVVWLESEISDLRAKVKESEARAEAFRSSSDLFGAGGQAGGTLASQQLADLNTELARVRSARAEAEARASQIRAGLANGSALVSLDVLRSDLIQRLSEQAVQLRAQRAQLSATLLPGHPRMKSINAQLADLDSQIKAEATKLLSGIENDARLAATREREILASLDRQKQAATKSNDDSVQLRALEREAGAQRDLLESYLRRYREALARQNGDILPANARVISRAAAPILPSFPQKLPLAIAAFAATFILAICFVIIRELARRQPVHALRYAVIGPPAGPLGTALTLTPDEGATYAPPTAPIDLQGVERSLDSIARRIRDRGVRRVLVGTVDENPPDGRPLGAVALARTLAQGGARTVLLDLTADGGDREAMGQEADIPGFSDLFAGESSFGQVIFRDRTSSVHFVPAGTRPLPEGWETDERLTTLLSALNHTYDQLVIDADRQSLGALAPEAGIVVLVAEGAVAADDTVNLYASVAEKASGEVIVLVAEPEGALEEA